MYALVDCNNFYVSCERVFNPILNKKPIVILSNNDRIFSCTHKDHLNDMNDETFGDAEATILHEMIHALGFPPSCSTNNKFFHVSLFSENWF